MIILSILISFMVREYDQLGYNQEFLAYTCELNKQTLSLNLKGHPKLVISEGFGAAFWFKYKQKRNAPLITIDTFDNSIPIRINERRRLEIENKTTELDELIPTNLLNDFKANTLQGGWYYLALSVRIDGAQVDRLSISLSLNYKIQEGIVVEKAIDQRQLFLVLGANKKYADCELESLFYQFYLFDSPISLASMDLRMLSTGFLQPVFLSKFGLEGPYNKFYSNLVQSGVGDMRNGADKSTFSLFSSLSTANNSIDRQANLANDLGVFFLPSKLFPSYQINNSYIFLIQYDLFYKDYAQASFDNLYYHVLYQRLPANGINRLIRVDLQMVMNPNDAYAYLRYILNDKVNKQNPYSLTLERSQGLRTVPFNYLMVKITQTALNPHPEITFINGYDDSSHSVRSNYIFKQSDQHVVGDFNPEDSTRREFLSFVSINEIAFFTGAYLKEERLRTSPLSYYSGLDKQITVLTCKKNNNPLRTKTNGQAIFDTCDPFVKESKLNRMSFYTKL